MDVGRSGVMRRIKNIVSFLFACVVVLVFQVEKVFAVNLDTSETVSLVLEVENPLNETKRVPVEYYLPKEILPQYIENAGGFSVKYNDAKGQYLLFKDVVLAPRETKIFSIDVKNVWTIPESALSDYLAQAKSAYDNIQKSEDGGKKSSAEYLLNSIKDEVQKIMNLQAQEKTVNEHIAAFKENEQRIDVIKENLHKLFQLETDLRKKIGKTLKLSKDTIENLILLVVIVLLLLIIVFLYFWNMKNRKGRLFKE
jgi:regulator of sigma D